ncbi:MAG: hypothetical protein V8S58_12665 [Lachnospiraceae bacterium]
MSEKYKEIMDQVRVTDEMKQRVLRNMKEQVEAEKASKLRMNAGNKVRTIRKQKSGERSESGKIIQSRFFSYGRTLRYLSAAACIMMLIVGGLTVPWLRIWIWTSAGIRRARQLEWHRVRLWWVWENQSLKRDRMNWAARLVP